MPAAVIAHGVGLDPAALETLRGEEGLLIHSAPRRADYTNSRKMDVYGECVWSHYSDFRLSWDVDADALVLGGRLGDYHPGMLLGTEGLAFANSEGTLPFRFDLGTAGRIIYESPEQDPVAGGLVRVKFRAVLEFAERRLIGGSAWGGADSAAYVSWLSALTTAGRVRGERGGMVGGPESEPGFVAAGRGSVFPETSSLSSVAANGWTVYAWREGSDGFISEGAAEGSSLVVGPVYPGVDTTVGYLYRHVLIAPA